VSENTKSISQESIASTRFSAIPEFVRSPGGLFGMSWLLFMVIASLTARWWVPVDPAKQDLFARLQTPSAEHWLGTDALGRDLLSRVFVAGALPILATTLMVFVALSIGLPLALIGAEHGGKIETAISRWAEMVMSLPGTVVLLAAIGAFGSRTYLVMIVLGVLISAPAYRIFVGVAKSTRQNLYVDAARVNGMSSLRINLNHILPAMFRVVAVQAAQLFGIGLIVIAGLAFLGFGPTEPTPSWGFMIAEASKNIFQGPWLLVPSGAALALTVISVNLLADSLSDNRGSLASIPRTKETKFVPDVHIDTSHDPEAVLSVRGVTVSVTDGPKLVSDVSFDLRVGRVLGLVGESGCGKTMTARSVLGLLPNGVRVSEGSIRWNGRELLGLSNKELRSLRGSEIAMISQQPMVALDPLFTVRYQLTKPIQRLRGVSKADANRIARELLDHVGIVDADRVLKTYPHQLSGGMAQRVSIALALTGEPKLLIADEPTTALDVTVQAEILSLLRHLVQTTGLSVVMVSHDLGVVADICDEVAVMYAGEVVESGPTTAVLNNPVHPYTMALLAANPHVSGEADVPVRLASIRGTVPAPGSWPTGCRFAGRCHFVKEVCGTTFELSVSHRTGTSLCIRSDELTASDKTWAPEAAGATLTLESSI